MERRQEVGEKQGRKKGKREEMKRKEIRSERGEGAYHSTVILSSRCKVLSSFPPPSPQSQPEVLALSYSE